jgi:hypothetical protein
MQINRYEDHAVFEIEGRENSSWTLFVIDDDWQWAVRMYERVASENFSEAAVDQVLLSFTGARGIYRTATALLPVYCRHLNGLGKLMIGDFRRDRNRDSWLETELKQCVCFTDTSYLIDLSDNNSDSILGETEVETLADLGVPLWRMAYLTVGARGRRNFDLETILKDSFDVNGSERLSAWFERVKGTIDYSFFLTNLTHHPSELSVGSKREVQSLADGEKIQEQVKRDKYGVWSWFTDTLHQILAGEDEINPLQVRYNYLCSKSFLRSAKDDSFPYVALRGFLFGLAKTFQINLEEIQQTWPTEPDQDNDCCFGFCSSSPDISFQLFTTCLRNFIDTFHSDTGGNLRIRFITLSIQNETVEVVLHISGKLPESIHQGTGRGLVTKTYESLFRCFPAESFLLSEGRDSIKLLFQRTLEL